MLNHLIIVPCHGIWKGGKDGETQSEWYLAPFQLEGNDHLCFKHHLMSAISLLKDPNTVVVISGGKTKKELEVSEAQSYFNLLKAVSPDVYDRVLLEEYAKDSFENVIFSLARFYQEYGVYPERITVLGFEFKRNRFLKNHFHQALGWDLNTVEYIGNSPTPQANHEQYFKDLDHSEYQFAVEYFQKDWYGCKDPLLKKKSSRNPFFQEHTYDKSNPLLTGFFRAMDQQLENDQIKNKLPWIRD